MGSSLLVLSGEFFFFLWGGAMAWLVAWLPTYRLLFHGYCADDRAHDGTRAIKSIEAGKRLPEANFANLKVAAHGQRSMLGLARAGGGASRVDGEKGERGRGCDGSAQDEAVSRVGLAGGREEGL